LNFCERRDLKPTISFRSAQLETIQALVHSGVGISLVAEMAARKKRPGLPEYRSLVSPKPERKIVAVWPRQRPVSRAANEFLKLISGSGKTLKMSGRGSNFTLHPSSFVVACGTC
jgi:LysR family transcriptional regulator, hydrogen peroxide-inducible genes activator